MSVISKEKAEQTSISLCKKHEGKADKLKKDFIKFLAQSYNKSIPKHILNSYKKSRSFFRTTSTIMVMGAGWSQDGYRDFYLDGSMDVLSNDARNYNSARYQPTKEMNDKLIDMKNAYEEAQEKYNKLLKETTTAILNLKTIKRITEQFPEAAACFPAQTYPVPVVINLDKLRSEFKDIKKPINA